MAAIDALLRALQRHGMDSLVLAPGQRPVLRQGDREHPVTKAALDAETISQLLGEISPAGTDPRPGGEFGFDYALDGANFRFLGGAEESGWSALARPVTGPAATEPTVPARPTAPPAEPTAPPVTPPAAPAPASKPIEAITDLLEILVDRGASDLHLSVGDPPRVRLDGELEELSDIEAPSGELLERLLREVTPGRQQAIFDETSDADFAYELPGRARFRVNLFRNRTGAAAVFRQIPNEIPTFEQLGLPEQLRRLAELSKGLVLVTGPTGSGKSTTLAALIDLVNKTRRDHIITIEDPIEFVHSSKGCLVSQREVGVHTQSFKRALRAALREDPDIVLVGEMRDLETTAIAIETAETGHLVFGTLHTTTASSTVERVVDQFPGDRQEQIRIMLSESLRAVIAQTLLKRVGGGRVAAFEILTCTPAVSNLIREGKTFQIPSALQTGKAQGMCQMTDSLLDLVENGIVEPREAYLKASDKEALLSKFRAGGIAFEPATPVRVEPEG